MNGDQPTSGDYAWSEAARANARITELANRISGRLDKIEACVQSLLDELENQELITVVDPESELHLLQDQE